eukprot:Skav225614  [mRNA]  locus=scaffold89:290232:293746:- [translate_table: standard]
MDEDERIAQQDERSLVRRYREVTGLQMWAAPQGAGPAPGYERYLGDCEQRAADGQREISFDEWAKQYEWRYDADERLKAPARKSFPECFSHTGPAPLPVEDWEVDYLTHKEIEKIMCFGITS